MIGDQIEVVILETEGDTVKIGISAPKNVSIYRKEIYDDIQQANQEASKVKVDVGQLRDTLKVISKMNVGRE